MSDLFISFFIVCKLSLNEDSLLIKHPISALLKVIEDVFSFSRPSLQLLLLFITVIYFKNSKL